MVLGFNRLQTCAGADTASHTRMRSQYFELFRVLEIARGWTTLPESTGFRRSEEVSFCVSLRHPKMQILTASERTRCYCRFRLSQAFRLQYLTKRRNTNVCEILDKSNGGVTKTIYREHIISGRRSTRRRLQHGNRGYGKFMHLSFGLDLSFQRDEIQRSDARPTLKSDGRPDQAISSLVRGWSQAGDVCWRPMVANRVTREYVLNGS